MVILEAIAKSNCTKFFVHCLGKIILFKKTNEISSWKQLRPICILPAWLIKLEKILKPAIERVITEKISKYQCGFRDTYNCNTAKIIAIYNTKILKKAKSLLIDIQKAYDSVNLEILRALVREKVGINAEIIDMFLTIYSELKYYILGTEFKPTRGLPQGSSMSPLLFSLYIDDVLVKGNNISDTHLVAFADDLNLQST